ncbi:MAG: hydroxymethylglutaryl-CoA synthase [Spirochaetales bacterium]
MTVSPSAFPPVGVHDIAVHLPRYSLEMSALLQARVAADPGIERHLLRAVASTGQQAMRWPTPTEDTITMAAEAFRQLLVRPNTPDLSKVRFLTLGTETSVDMSKSGSAYVQGLMQRSGFPVPISLSSYQVQHACAGGALAMMTTASFLQVAGRTDESAVVLMSDVARYQAPSTAEVTQGAGAAALWVTQNPDLLEFDFLTAGFASRDVDDFFRPLGSTIAKVKGGFSLACYHESLADAFADHCQRAGVDPAEELRSVDVFCLHAPYARMPVVAMERLLATHLGLDAEAANVFLEERGFSAGLIPTSQVGNLYTGSLWLNLAASLAERAKVFGPSLVGKKVLLASYGSGNTMTVFTGRLAAKAPQVIARWNLDAQLANKEEPGLDTYQFWIDTHRTPENFPEILANYPPRAGQFALTGLRADGYREYQLV